MILYNINKNNIHTSAQPNKTKNFTALRTSKLDPKLNHKYGPIFSQDLNFWSKTTRAGQQGPCKQPLYKQKKSKISLFVNILMKNGKKTKALQVLEKSLFIFMQSIITIKMQPFTLSPTKEELAPGVVFDSFPEKPYPVQPLNFPEFKEVSQKHRGSILFLRNSCKNNAKSFCNPSENILFFADHYHKTTPCLKACHKGIPCKARGSSFRNPLQDIKKKKTLPLAKAYPPILCLKNLFKPGGFLEFCKNNPPVLAKQYKSAGFYLGKPLSKETTFFPFIGNFYRLFEKFYSFKIFNLKGYPVYKKEKGYFYKLLSPLDLKKGTPFGLSHSPWYKYFYSEASFVEKSNLLGVLYCKPYPLSVKETCTLPVKEENLWYHRREKRWVSWEQLSPAQKNCLLFSLYKAISNVKPPLECRSKRFGGRYRQIPATVSEHRQLAYAIGWIIEAAAQGDTSQRKKKITTRLQDSRGVATSFVSTKGQEVDLDAHKNQVVLPLKAKPLAPSLSRSLKIGKQKGVVFFKNKQNLKGKNNFLSKETLFARKSCKIPPYFCFFLADALKDAYQKRGSAVEKRNLWVDTALANRAYLRFRWW